ncbi:GIY-YIG nuclease family protein [Gemmata sp. JC673]|uniref:GIY-YIG nuclease family protein n=1 Tax=Gemmata algarum TaxID=2975278 RepID=A0ABU5F2T3_9BACT|nr:GIY-YIG nuclease family protein [Gemmata algarum]MDY3561891.1 GIY-YIG nuclease family protein [Gemmata algarum]
MFAVALIVLALAGGSTATYFLMDAPRREALKRLAAVLRDREDLEADREELEIALRAHEQRSRQLAAAVAANDRRAADLGTREAALERRVISYNDLTAENQLLRTELKNAAVHAAYLEQVQHASRSGASSAADQRDRLGRLYFEEIASAARRQVGPTTFATAVQRVQAAARQVRADGVGLTLEEEDAAQTALHKQFERVTRAQVEREVQARLRDQAREEQARQREAEELARQAEQAERERAAVAAALERALTDVAGRHATEVEQLRAQLAEAEAKSQRAKSLAQQTRNGHVYVISNIGSFGPDVFKIGMTRRKEPQHRVDELGDASVPFPFDVHMMIRCDDAPALEAALHQTFRDHRVNRVNLRKEFFRVPIEDIATAVRAHHGEVEYMADPEALEYLNSRSATEAELQVIEQAHARAEAALPVAADD